MNNNGIYQNGGVLTEEVEEQQQQPEVERLVPGTVPEVPERSSIVPSDYTPPVTLTPEEQQEQQKLLLQYLDQLNRRISIQTGQRAADIFGKGAYVTQAPEKTPDPGLWRNVGGIIANTAWYDAIAGVGRALEGIGETAEERKKIDKEYDDFLERNQYKIHPSYQASEWKDLGEKGWTAWAGGFAQIVGSNLDLLISAATGAGLGYTTARLLGKTAVKTGVKAGMQAGQAVGFATTYGQIFESTYRGYRQHIDSEDALPLAHAVSALSTAIEFMGFRFLTQPFRKMMGTTGAQITLGISEKEALQKAVAATVKDIPVKGLTKKIIDTPGLFNEKVVLAYKGIKPLLRGAIGEGVEEGLQGLTDIFGQSFYNAVSEDWKKKFPETNMKDAIWDLSYQVTWGLIGGGFLSSPLLFTGVKEMKESVFGYTLANHDNDNKISRLIDIIEDERKKNDKDPKTGLSTVNADRLKGFVEHVRENAETLKQVKTGAGRYQLYSMARIAEGLENFVKTEGVREEVKGALPQIDALIAAIKTGISDIVSKQDGVKQDSSLYFPIMELVEANKYGIADYVSGDYFRGVFSTKALGLEDFVKKVVTPAPVTAAAPAVPAFVPPTAGVITTPKEVPVEYIGFDSAKSQEENDRLNKVYQEAIDIPDEDFTIDKLQQLINKDEVLKAMPEEARSELYNKVIEEKMKILEEREKGEKTIKYRIKEIKAAEEGIEAEVTKVEETILYLEGLLKSTQKNIHEGVLAPVEAGIGNIMQVLGKPETTRQEYQILNDIKNRIITLREQQYQLRQRSNDLKKQRDYYNNLIADKTLTRLNRTELVNRRNNIDKKLGIINNIIQKIEQIIEKTIQYLDEFAKVISQRFALLSKVKQTGFLGTAEQLQKLLNIRRTGKEDAKEKAKYLLTNWDKLGDEMLRLEISLGEAVEAGEVAQEALDKENVRRKELIEKVVKYQNQIRYLDDLIDNYFNDIREVKRPVAPIVPTAPVTPTKGAPVTVAPTSTPAPKPVSISALAAAATLTTPTTTAAKVVLTPEEKVAKFKTDTAFDTDVERLDIAYNKWSKKKDYSDVEDFNKEIKAFIDEVVALPEDKRIDKDIKDVANKYKSIRFYDVNESIALAKKEMAKKPVAVPAAAESEKKEVVVEKEEKEEMTLQEKKVDIERRRQEVEDFASEEKVQQWIDENQDVIKPSIKIDTEQSGDFPVILDRYTEEPNRLILNIGYPKLSKEVKRNTGGHGIARKGHKDQIKALLNIITTGKLTGDEAPLIDAKEQGKHLVNAYSDGDFMLIAKPRQSLRDNNNKLQEFSVVLNGRGIYLYDKLKNAFPHINFIKATELTEEALSNGAKYDAEIAALKKKEKEVKVAEVKKEVKVEKKAEKLKKVIKKKVKKKPEPVITTPTPEQKIEKDKELQQQAKQDISKVTLQVESIKSLAPKYIGERLKSFISKLPDRFSRNETIKENELKSILKPFSAEEKIKAEEELRTYLKNYAEALGAVPETLNNDILLLSETIISQVEIRSGNSEDSRRTYNNVPLSDNAPDLHALVEYLKKLLPDLKFTFVKHIAATRGYYVAARVFKDKDGFTAAISNSATQKDVVHEASHILAPLVWNQSYFRNLFKDIHNTDYYRTAKALYHDKSEDTIRLEAVIRLLEEPSLEVIKTKMNGSWFEKFKLYLREFWLGIKSYLKGLSRREAAQLAALRMFNRRNPVHDINFDIYGREYDKRNDRGADLTNFTAKFLKSAFSIFRNPRGMSPVTIEKELQKYAEQMMVMYIRKNPTEKDYKIFRDYYNSIITAYREYSRIGENENVIREDARKLATIDSNQPEADDDNDPDTSDREDYSEYFHIDSGVRMLLSHIPDGNGNIIPFELLFQEILNLSKDTILAEHLQSKLENYSLYGVQGHIIQAFRNILFNEGFGRPGYDDAARNFILQYLSGIVIRNQLTVSMSFDESARSYLPVIYMTNRQRTPEAVETLLNAKMVYVSGQEDLMDILKDGLDALSKATTLEEFNRIMTDKEFLGVLREAYSFGGISFFDTLLTEVHSRANQVKTEAEKLNIFRESLSYLMKSVYDLEFRKKNLKNIIAAKAKVFFDGTSISSRYKDGTIADAVMNKNLLYVLFNRIKNFTKAFSDAVMVGYDNPLIKHLTQYNDISYFGDYWFKSASSRYNEFTPADFERASFLLYADAISKGQKFFWMPVNVFPGKSNVPLIQAKFFTGKVRDDAARKKEIEGLLLADMSFYTEQEKHERNLKDWYIEYNEAKRDNEEKIMTNADTEIRNILSYYVRDWQTMEGAFLNYEKYQQYVKNPELVSQRAEAIFNKLMDMAKEITGEGNHWGNASFLHDMYRKGLKNVEKRGSYARSYILNSFLNRSYLRLIVAGNTQYYGNIRSQDKYIEKITSPGNRINVPRLHVIYLEDFVPKEATDGFYMVSKDMEDKLIDFTRGHNVKLMVYDVGNKHAPFMNKGSGYLLTPEFMETFKGDESVKQAFGDFYSKMQKIIDSVGKRYGTEDKKADVMIVFSSSVKTKGAASRMKYDPKNKKLTYSFMGVEREVVKDTDYDSIFPVTIENPYEGINIINQTVISRAPDESVRQRVARQAIGSVLTYVDDSTMDSILSVLSKIVDSNYAKWEDTLMVKDGKDEHGKDKWRYSPKRLLSAVKASMEATRSNVRRQLDKEKEVHADVQGAVMNVLEGIFRKNVEEIELAGGNYQMTPDFSGGQLQDMHYDTDSKKVVPGDVIVNERLGKIGDTIILIRPPMSGLYNVLVAKIVGTYRSDLRTDVIVPVGYMKRSNSDYDGDTGMVLRRITDSAADVKEFTDKERNMGNKLFDFLSEGFLLRHPNEDIAADIENISKQNLTLDRIRKITDKMEEEYLEVEEIVSKEEKIREYTPDIGSKEYIEKRGKEVGLTVSYDLSAYSKLESLGKQKEIIRGVSILQRIGEPFVVYGFKSYKRGSEYEFAKSLPIKKSKLTGTNKLEIALYSMIDKTGGTILSGQPYDLVWNEVFKTLQEYGISVDTANYKDLLKSIGEEAGALNLIANRNIETIARFKELSDYRNKVIEDIFKRVASHYKIPENEIPKPTSNDGSYILNVILKKTETKKLKADSWKSVDDDDVHNYLHTFFPKSNYYEEKFKYTTSEGKTKIMSSKYLLYHFFRPDYVRMDMNSKYLGDKNKYLVNFTPRRAVGWVSNADRVLWALNRLGYSPANNYIFNGRSYNSFSRSAFIDLGELQHLTVTDAKEHLFHKTGITPQNAYIADTMLMLGMDMGEVFDFMRMPTIRRFSMLMEEMWSQFTGKQYEWYRNTYLQMYKILQNDYTKVLMGAGYKLYENEFKSLKSELGSVFNKNYQDKEFNATEYRKEYKRALNAIKELYRAEKKPKREEAMKAWKSFFVNEAKLLAFVRNMGLLGEALAPSKRVVRQDHGLNKVKEVDAFGSQMYFNFIEEESKETGYGLIKDAQGNIVTSVSFPHLTETRTRMQREFFKKVHSLIVPYANISTLVKYNGKYAEEQIFPKVSSSKTISAISAFRKRMAVYAMGNSYMLSTESKDVVEAVFAMGRIARGVERLKTDGYAIGKFVNNAFLAMLKVETWKRPVRFEHDKDNVREFRDYKYLSYLDAGWTYEQIEKARKDFYSLPEEIQALLVDYAIFFYGSDFLHGNSYHHLLPTEIRKEIGSAWTSEKNLNEAKKTELNELTYSEERGKKGLGYIVVSPNMKGVEENLVTKEDVTEVMEQELLFHVNKQEIKKGNIFKWKNEEYEVLSWQRGSIEWKRAEAKRIGINEDDERSLIDKNIVLIATKAKSKSGTFNWLIVDMDMAKVIGVVAKTEQSILPTLDFMEPESIVVKERAVVKSKTVKKIMSQKQVVVGRVLPRLRITKGYDSYVEPLVDIINAAQEKEKIDVRLKNAKRQTFYFNKDLIKGSISEKLIAIGIADSATNSYAVAVGDLANTGNYVKGEVVMVSINGIDEKRPGRIDIKDERLTGVEGELTKAVAAGVYFVTDNKYNRERKFNIGERELAVYLEQNGYVPVGTDGKNLLIWAKDGNNTNRKHYSDVMNSGLYENKIYLIRDNPKMYNAVIAEMEKIYPGIKTKVLSQPLTKDGKVIFGYYDVLEDTIAWAQRDGRVETVPHEYLERFLELFSDHPLVKEGESKAGGRENLVRRVTDIYMDNKFEEVQGTWIGRWINKFVGFISRVFGSSNVYYVIEQAFKKGKFTDDAEQTSVQKHVKTMEKGEETGRFKYYSAPVSQSSDTGEIVKELNLTTNFNIFNATEFEKSSFSLENYADKEQLPGTYTDSVNLFTEQLSALDLTKENAWAVFSNFITKVLHDYKKAWSDAVERGIEKEEIPISDAAIEAIEDRLRRWTAGKKSQKPAEDALDIVNSVLSANKIDNAKFWLKVDFGEDNKQIKGALHKIFNTAIRALHSQRHVLFFSDKALYNTSDGSKKVRSISDDAITFADNLSDANNRKRRNKWLTSLAETKFGKMLRFYLRQSAYPGQVLNFLLGKQNSDPAIFHLWKNLDENETLKIQMNNNLDANIAAINTDRYKEGTENKFTFKQYITPYQSDTKISFKEIKNKQEFSFYNSIGEEKRVQLSETELLSLHLAIEDDMRDYGDTTFGEIVKYTDSKGEIKTSIRGGRGWTFNIEGEEIPERKGTFYLTKEQYKEIKSHALSEEGEKMINAIRGNLKQLHELADTTEKEYTGVGMGYRGNTYWVYESSGTKGISVPMHRFLSDVRHIRERSVKDREGRLPARNIRDVFTVMEQYTRTMLNYSYMQLPVDNARKFLHELIEMNKNGRIDLKKDDFDAFVNYFNELIKNIEDAVPKEDTVDSVGRKVMMGILNNLTKSTLGLNLVIQFYQSSATLFQSGYIPMRYWFTDVPKSVIFWLKNVFGFRGYNKHLAELVPYLREVMEKVPLAMVRYGSGTAAGFYDFYRRAGTTYGSKAMKIPFLNKEFNPDILTRGIEMNDAWVIAHTYRNFKNFFAKQYPNLNEKQMDTLLRDAMTDWIIETQGTSVVTQRSPLLRTRNIYIQSMMWFMNQPSKIFMHQVQSFANLMFTAHGSRYQQYAKTLLWTNIFIFLFANSVWVGIGQYLREMILGRKRVKKELMKENAVSDVMGRTMRNALNNMPILGMGADLIYTLVDDKGWYKQATLPQLDLANQATRSIGALVEAKTKEREITGILGITKTTARATGMPAMGVDATFATLNKMGIIEGY